MNDAESRKNSTRDNAFLLPKQRENQGKNSGRLIAYYILLFFFIFLTSLLLRELEQTNVLQRYERLDEIVRNTFKLPAEIDDIAVTLFSLLFSFVFILPIGWTYTLTKDEDDFDPSLVQTIVVLAMVVTGVMVVVGSDLARAFGLAGVVAAVRFRNTLKDTKDAIYVFIAVAIGMGCGYQIYHVVVFLSLIMSLTMFLLWRYKFGTTRYGNTQGFAARFGGEEEKGKKKVAKRLYENISAEAYQRLEQELEQQVRLMHWADLMIDKGKKKANAALIIASNDAQAAQQRVDSVLSSYGGRWQLANMIASTSGNITLEYVGRLPKAGNPADLIGVLQKNGASVIAGIEFRSLKRLKKAISPKTSSQNDEPED
jgi:hypothetical protein